MNPYTGSSTWHFDEILHKLIEAAIANRNSQLTLNPPPPAAIPSTARGDQLRGIDDPHEWALGRPGAATVTVGTQLSHDPTWFDIVQPGAAGTWLGKKEAMLVHDGRVYVVGAEGVVTAFQVDLTAGNRQRLVRVACSHDQTGRPMSLGHGGTALAVLPGGEIVVGTRRHLAILNASTLAVVAQVELPWEVAQPHHMKVADVLPAAIHAGPEIIFASVHGGLVFYSSNGGTPSPVYEWPEPGIVDFEVQGGVVTILSQRGVVADVAFDAMGASPTPRLVAAARPFPRKLLQHVPPGSEDPILDGPSQGDPVDLELMKMNWGSAGFHVYAVGMWTGDEDGIAVRAYSPDRALTIPFATNLEGSFLGRGGVDIATCLEGSASGGGTGEVVIGDHLLVLVGDRLHLYNQLGQLLGFRNLNWVVQTGNPPQPANRYMPFGCQTHVMAVGDLVDNSATGSSGPYDQEVVVATQSGALLWLHINDILNATTDLPPSYHLAVGGATSSIQPRTNQSMSATWGITQRAGDTARLHLLDQRGGYWTVTANGAVELRDREIAGAGARGWDDLGNRDAIGNPIPLTSTGWQNTKLEIGLRPLPSGYSLSHRILPKPWCPLDAVNVSFELSGGPYLLNNWIRSAAPSYSFQGFVVHHWSGAVVDTGLGREVWSWGLGANQFSAWGNLIQGIRFPPLPGSTWNATGIWASTDDDGTTGAVADRLDYHDLRSFVGEPPIMTHQAIRAFTIPGSGAPVLVLGCPGGGVRVLLPGAMATSALFSQHSLGTIAATSADYGYGGGALAAKQMANGDLQIWFGTLYEPPPRPADYPGTAPGILGNGEVASGGVHLLTWSPSSPANLTTVQSRGLTPTPSLPRGGYGVVGMAVGDVLAGIPGDELVVATLSGDIMVLNPTTLTELWRTHVPGGVGYCNSIRIANLNAPLDSLNELYVAGSFGIWRFEQPGEM